MTVTELREALQKLEAEGKGGMPIGFDLVVCYDSDYEIEFEEVSEVAEQAPAGTSLCWRGHNRHRIELL